MSDSAGEGVTASAFVDLRLTGDRFDPKGMPADAMIEIQALSDILYEMAREEWLEAHPDRRRVPAGFEELFDLRLVSIGEGSSRPQLVLHRSPATVGDLEADNIFEAMHRAPQRLHTALRSVVEDHVLPPGFPVKYAPKIAKLGKSLGDEETLQIAPPPVTADDGTATPIPPAIVVDRQVRQTLAAIDELLRERPEPIDVDVEGVVTEFDGTGQSFRLKVFNQASPARCTIAPGEFTLAAEVKAVLAADGVTAPDVRVRGTGIPDPQGRLPEIHDVIEIEVVRTVREKKLLARIELLESLEDGWYDTHSVKPQEGVMAAVRDLLQTIARFEVRPDLVARDDGSVAFEVTHADLRCVAVIEDEGRQMYLFADDGSEDGGAEVEGPFEAPLLAHFLQTGTLR